MEMEPMLSKKPKTNGDEKEKRKEREKKEKGNGSDSDSSGEECGTVRTHRISNTLRPRITGFTPSPRVSTTSQPVGASNMSCVWQKGSLHIKLKAVCEPLQSI